MKTRKLFFLVFFLAAFTVSAQSQVKVGYTNAEYILSFLPEAKEIEAELSDYQKQLGTQLESKATEFRTKVDAYQKEAQNMIPEVRADTERELQNLQQSIQKFEQDAQAALQKKQAELLQPAYDKIQKAIDKVAKDNGYTIILNSGQPEMGIHVLLYARDQDNISNLVLKELGITPPPDEPATEDGSN